MNVTDSFGAPAEQVCVANIGPNERRRRLLGGMAGLVLGAIVSAALIAAKASPILQTLPFMIFWGGAIGVFQWRDKT